MSHNNGEPTLKDIFDEIDDVKQSINRLDQTKQDKVSPTIVVTLLLFLFAQTVSGVWWASRLSNVVFNVEQKIQDLGNDRFYGKDGDTLARLFNLKLETKDAKIDTIGVQIDKIDKAVNKIEEKMQTVELIQERCRQKLGVDRNGRDMDG